MVKRIQPLPTFPKRIKANLCAWKQDQKWSSQFYRKYCKPPRKMPRPLRLLIFLCAPTAEAAFHSFNFHWEYKHLWTILMHNLKRSGKEQGDRKEQKNLNANLKFAGRNKSVELKVKGSRSFLFSIFIFWV